MVFSASFAIEALSIIPLYLENAGAPILGNSHYSMSSCHAEASQMAEIEAPAETKPEDRICLPYEDACSCTLVVLAKLCCLDLIPI